MADGMEDIEVHDPPETPKEAALTLWIAGSVADVGRWIQDGSIPLTVCASPQKGSYVGFRDNPDRAAERHQQRCSTEGKSFSKEDTLFLEIHLNSEAYVKMSTDKIKESGRGWVTRLHCETFSRSGVDWGVWYYFGEPFNLRASGVSVFLKCPN